MLVALPWMGACPTPFEEMVSPEFGIAYFKASKNQCGRKIKQPAPSSGPANSSGTANTAGPSPSSAPSTPSSHTPGDVISMPSLQHNIGAFDYVWV